MARHPDQALVERQGGASEGGGIVLLMPCESVHAVRGLGQACLWVVVHVAVGWLAD